MAHATGRRQSQRAREVNGRSWSSSPSASFTYSTGRCQRQQQRQQQQQQRWQRHGAKRPLVTSKKKLSFHLSRSKRRRSPPAPPPAPPPNHFVLLSSRLLLRQKGSFVLVGWEGAISLPAVSRALITLRRARDSKLATFDYEYALPVLNAAGARRDQLQPPARSGVKQSKSCRRRLFFPSSR
jgi:hypothetical protein